ncbi:MAG: aminoacetone oxidase family FAD-binding enzyme, partial [Flavitalea sp.]
MQKKLIVIGGGASGFFCAVNAKRLDPSLDVVIVEKSSKILSKVRISGGGRCNVTHNCFEIPVMSKRYPRGHNLVKKTFHGFFTTDTIAWFGERGVKIVAEADGRMFPVTNTSETIIDCLVREMNRTGVKLIYNMEVSGLVPENNKWSVQFSRNNPLEADYVCIACGGYPKLSSFGWLTELGHKVEAPVPSLFTFNMPGNDITTLMGVSVESAQVKIAGTKLHETGPLLITHWGLSGPAVLRLSAWGARVLAEQEYRFTAIVSWVGERKEPEIRELLQQQRSDQGAAKISSRNVVGLPNRLWEYLLL